MLVIENDKPVAAALASLRLEATLSQPAMLTGHASGREGGYPWVMTIEYLRYAQPLIADRTCNTPATYRELNKMPTRVLCHRLRADGSSKDPGCKLIKLQMRAGNLTPSTSPWGTIPVGTR